MLRRLAIALALAVAAGLLAAAGAGASEAAPPEDGREGFLGLVTEQLVVLATVAGAIAVMPELVEWLASRRKRREMLALSVEEIDVAGLPARAAGHDALLAANQDLIDAVRHARSAPQLGVGNEILIIGPPMSGRKSLALRLAQSAGIARALVLHNAANVDALAWTRDRLDRAKASATWLLVIPHIDRVHARADDDELLSQLEALIESASARRNILVVGTADTLEPDDPLDNLFGVKLLMPGVTPDEVRQVPRHPDAIAYHRAVAEHYAGTLADRGAAFRGIDRAAWVDRVVAVVGNPAEIEDIANLCLTTAQHRGRGQGGPPAIDADVLERAIARIIVGACHAGPPAAA